MASPLQFLDLPNEIKVEIISHLPLPSMLNFRLVSFHCKDLVSAYYHRFVCSVSDATYDSLSNATEIFHTVKVSNLSGPKSVPMSSTRGVGRLLGIAKCLHLVGVRISEAELRKMGRYAGNISELIFERSSSPILKALVDKSAFVNVTSLSLKLNYEDGGSQSTFLGTLAELAEEHLLPHVYHLGFYWTSSSNACELFTPDELLEKLKIYMTTIAVILVFQKNLRSLEICRDPWTTSHMWLYLGRDLIAEGERQVITTLATALRALKLERLKLQLFSGDGVYWPCNLETAIVQGQGSLLKELTMEKTFSFVDLDDVQQQPPTLQSLLPVTPPENLTRVSISFSPFARAPVDLSYFSGCRSLKALALNCFCDSFETEPEHQTVRITELKKLPKSLESLKLIPPRDLPRTFGAQNPGYLTEAIVLLTKQQVEWLVQGNLPKLTYLGCMMVAKGKDNLSTAEIQIRNRLIRDRRSPSRRRQFFVQNLDLPLFQKMVGVGTLRTLELNMVDVEDVGGTDDAIADHISIVEMTTGLEEYFDFCRQAENVGGMKLNVVRGRYVEMTIKK